MKNLDKFPKKTICQKKDKISNKNGKFSKNGKFLNKNGKFSKKWNFF